MNNTPEFLHYATIVLPVAITSLGVGIGEGLTSLAAIEAINRQPRASSDILKLTVLCMALIETAAIMGVVVSLMLLFDMQKSATMYSGIAQLGIIFAICIPGFVIGIMSSLPAREAFRAIARQPFFAHKIFHFTLITLSIIQTPVIFGFLIAMFIKSHAHSITTYAQSLQLLASGLCIGLGSIGPSIGMALFAKSACNGIGLNRNAYNKIFTFTIISEAIIETPVIFSVVVALLIIGSSQDITLLKGIALLSAGLCTGLGTIGPGISSGKTAAAACRQIALNPEQYHAISRISMFAQGLIDTSAIYALMISVALIVWT